MVVRSVYLPKFDKRGGLVPVIVQDTVHRDVLMVAYTNEECWLQTLRTGIATFWSTSRNKVWVKGEESGNTMLIDDIRVDCDGDALLYLVFPQGNALACHMQTRTCFYRSIITNKTSLRLPNEGENEKLIELTMEVHDSFPD